MTRTRPQAPRTPCPAQRAKSIAARGGPAVLMPAVAREPASGPHTEPVLHHVHAGGRASILLPDDDPLVLAVGDPADTTGAATPQGELAVTLEITDEAPVSLRSPVRGLLWLTGWLRGLDPRTARTRAATIAEQRAEPSLLDLGHGLTMLDLVPASFVLADPEGTHSLTAQTFGSASPDPFCRQETAWLRHLEHAHPEVVTALARHLPDELRGGRIRPLGIDRYGLRLRVEHPGDLGDADPFRTPTDDTAADGTTADHDVRLAFGEPVDCRQQLGLALRRLIGCPFGPQS
ncbi:DUF2470 domain-containing protein [Prauserella halophila]|uniref:DUF2470 domain-containing protein n=1 Tax=Prauserella halophila TaxID=185641 RepID=A0ABN1WKP7_9PSEU|nr:DUF2470 domain-containing protein [Prauserella halophila]MCP2237657.1 Protein of unknown function (DUF2470) [Prauserella halophila]